MKYLNNLIPRRRQNFKILKFSKFFCSKLQLSKRVFQIFFFPCLTWGMAPLWSAYNKFRDYQGIQTKTIAFLCPFENSILNSFDSEGLKLLTRLRFGFSHLNENRFRHNFQGCLNPSFTCSLETENTSHYLLHCHHNTSFRSDSRTVYRGVARI